MNIETRAMRMLKLCNRLSDEIQASKGILEMPRKEFVSESAEYATELLKLANQGRIDCENGSICL